jgi:polyhydroxyalkanoate synthesis repressor PhaR
MAGSDKSTTTKRAGTKQRNAANGKANDPNSPDVTTIKKYANRRLYNTATSSYVTLDHLCQMVKDGEDFVVYDAKTGENITRSVLTQIIVEEESKGQNLLPIGFLRQLIGFYGDSLQMVVPRYLDHVMSTFSENQDRTRSHMQDALGELFPFGQFEELSKQNMAMFESALSMFNPASATNPKPPAASSSTEAPSAEPKSGPTPERPPEPSPKPNAGAELAGTLDPLKMMQNQLDFLQQQLRTMTSGKPDDRSS